MKQATVELIATMIVSSLTSAVIGYTLGAALGWWGAFVAAPISFGIGAVSGHWLAVSQARRGVWW